MDRVIGRFEGAEKGPLLIVFGAMHGNEPAGVNAMKLMFKMLEVEPITNPSFVFKGKLVGLIGNLAAFKLGTRFIEKDLNRQFTSENINRVKSIPAVELQAEDLELKELIAQVDKEISAYDYTRLVFLDLHTTTAFGGIFTITAEDEESERIGVALHAPVVKGLLKGISGTTLHYFTAKNFNTEISAVTFESGQHNEDLSVNRAIAAITNCLRTLECIKPEHVENRHDSLLNEFSKDLPKIAELITVHPIKEGDDFVMMPGYKNFQTIKKGELLAKDNNGEIRASDSGLILMPLYQKKGEDGFFLIRTLEAF